MRPRRLANEVRRAASVLHYVYTHPANRRQKGRALARAVRFQVEGRLGKRTIVPIGHGMRMWAVRHHTASSKVAYANPPDWPEMQAWRRLLRVGDLFVDVGSNVGSYALWAADLGAQVIAVEPDDEAAHLLEENVALNPGARIEILPCALAHAPGVMSFTEGLDTIGHLLPNGGGRQVEVRTLDEVLAGRTAAGVKIDVEGAERLVLEGAMRSLAGRRIKALQLEWNDLSTRVLGEDRNPVAAILQRNGYRLFRPDDNGGLRPVEQVSFGDDLFAVLSEPGDRRARTGATP